MKLVWWQDLDPQYLSSIYFNDSNETAEVQKSFAMEALQKKSKLVILFLIAILWWSDFYRRHNRENKALWNNLMC